MTEHISIPFFDITDKVVLITGASGGLGQAAARGLSGAGAKVMLTGRHEDMQQVNPMMLTICSVSSPPPLNTLAALMS